MNSGSYNPEWCKEKHEKLDKKIEAIEQKTWAILLLLFGNLAGVVGILITLLAGGC